YAAPNLYAPDPAIQVSGQSSATLVEQAAVDRISSALNEADIAFKSVEIDEDSKSALIRLSDREQQLRAQAITQRTLGDGYIVALNLAPTTPDWMAALGGKPMKLGLDLSGGVHFLFQVDTPTAVKKNLELSLSGIKQKLREAKVRGFVDVQNDRIIGRFKDGELAAQATDIVRKEYPELILAEEADADGVRLLWSLSEQKIRDIENYSVEQNLTTLRNRVNELGVAEPLVQRQGRNRIVV